MNTLAWFARNEENICLPTNATSGPVCQTSASRSRDAVLCWAGVYRGPQAVMQVPEEVASERLLCLHALTAPGHFQFCIRTMARTSVGDLQSVTIVRGIIGGLGATSMQCPSPAKTKNTALSLLSAQNYAGMLPAPGRQKPFARPQRQNLIGTFDRNAVQA
jgi:hypothetical protein